MRHRYRDGWFKVSRRIVDSSLWTEDPLVLKVWVFLLEQSQAGTSLRPGTVIMSRQILAARCLLSAEQLEFALGRLSSPDPQSRTPRKEGRRIEILPNGFRLVNHGEYHDADAAAKLSKVRRDAGRRGAVASNRTQQEARNQRFDEQQTASKPAANEQQTETETETEKETRQQTGADAPFAGVAAESREPYRVERKPRADRGTAAQRAALDKCSDLIGRKLSYSKANVDAIARAEANYTGDQVARVLLSVRDGSTPTGSWCRDRLGSGLPLAYILRPGTGAADRILEQLQNGDFGVRAPASQAAQAREDAMTAGIMASMKGDGTVPMGGERDGQGMAGRVGNPGGVHALPGPDRVGDRAPQSHVPGAPRPPVGRGVDVGGGRVLEAHVVPERGGAGGGRG